MADKPVFSHQPHKGPQPIQPPPEVQEIFSTPEDVPGVVGTCNSDGEEQGTQTLTSGLVSSSRASKISNTPEKFNATMEVGSPLPSSSLYLADSGERVQKDLSHARNGNTSKECITHKIFNTTNHHTNIYHASPSQHAAISSSSLPPSSTTFACSSEQNHSGHSASDTGVNPAPGLQPGSMQRVSLFILDAMKAGFSSVACDVAWLIQSPPLRSIMWLGVSWATQLMLVAFLLVVGVWMVLRLFPMLLAAGQLWFKDIACQGFLQSTGLCFLLTAREQHDHASMTSQPTNSQPDLSMSFQPSTIVSADALMLWGSYYLMVVKAIARLYKEQQGLDLAGWELPGLKLEGVVYGLDVTEMLYESMDFLAGNINSGLLNESQRVGWLEHNLVWCSSNAVIDGLVKAQMQEAAAARAMQMSQEKRWIDARRWRGCELQGNTRWRPWKYAATWTCWAWWSLVGVDDNESESTHFTTTPIHLDTHTNLETWLAETLALLKDLLKTRESWLEEYRDLVKTYMDAETRQQWCDTSGAAGSTRDYWHSIKNKKAGMLSHFFGVKKTKERGLISETAGDGWDPRLMDLETNAKTACRMHDPMQDHSKKLLGRLKTYINWLHIAIGQVDERLKLLRERMSGVGGIYCCGHHLENVGFDGIHGFPEGALLLTARDIRETQQIMLT